MLKWVLSLCPLRNNPRLVLSWLTIVQETGIGALKRLWSRRSSAPAQALYSGRGDRSLAWCPKEEFGSLLDGHSYPTKMGKEGCCRGRTAGRNLIWVSFLTRLLAPFCSTTTLHLQESDQMSVWYECSCLYAWRRWHIVEPNPSMALNLGEDVHKIASCPDLKGA